MTDKKFEELLYNLTQAHRNYSVLLFKAENEYKSRFGSYPGEVDDDFWIDSFHTKASGASLKDVTINANLHKNKEE